MPLLVWAHPVTNPTHPSLANPALRQGVEAALARCPILQNRYFVALRRSTLGRDAFRDSQQQFYFAVRFFSRPMAALMARMPTSTARQALLHNLAEEHGFVEQLDLPGSPPGNAGIRPGLAHDLTFLAFLGTLGTSVDEMRRQREGPSVRAFNLGIMGACLTERTEMAFACLSIIEFVFADISALIGRVVVERGWVPAGQLVHYQLHAEIDKRHAAEFFGMVEPAWNESGEPHRAVADGFALGLHLFNRLYDDLWNDVQVRL